MALGSCPHLVTSGHIDKIDPFSLGLPRVLFCLLVLRLNSMWSPRCQHLPHQLNLFGFPSIARSQCVIIYWSNSIHATIILHSKCKIIIVLKWEQCLMALTITDGSKFKSDSLPRETWCLPLENPRSIPNQMTSKKHSKMEHTLSVLTVGEKCDTLRSIYATDPHPGDWK